MPGPVDFAKLVPGFDFLQSLMKGAGGTLPNMGQWIAPTLDPAEIEKRIEQLRTVQFWLEQNAKMLATTIQALEVQRMTLATLKGMNLPLDDVRNAFTLGVPPAAAADAQQAAALAANAAAAMVGNATPKAKPAARKTAASAAKATQAAAPAANAVADPMQWWGALTQQFTELASKALKDSSAEAARHLAGQALTGAMKGVVKGAVDAASGLPRKVAGARKRSR